MTSSEEFDTFTLTGDGGEDKPIEGGETQAVAAMLIIATALGTKAVKERKFFKRAIIFGHARATEGSKLIPYRLQMDFNTRKNKLFKSTSVTPSQYFYNVKKLLENPSTFISCNCHPYNF